MGMLSRPAPEVEAADDFVLTSQTILSNATFIGLLPLGSPSVSQVRIEVYRVFPLDSVSPPSGLVPTRVNSPSDVEFDNRDTATSSLSFTTTVLSPSFTVANTVVNGINPIPGQVTGGEGPATGQEVRFDVSFNPPLVLPADHYFFVPQVQLSAGNFLWLSAPKPIVAPGTPFPTDLQAWIRNTALDPDWLRVGTDIVGGSPAPTFNGAFSLAGRAVAPTTIGVFRNALWYLNSQSDGSAPEFTLFYGGAADVSISGDWNCSGTRTPGMFRNGAWYLTDFKNGSPTVNYSFFFGAAGDIPVVGDWDGDGCDSVGIFRNGLWYLTNAITGSPTVNYSFFFGAAGDKPVTGDWDGNGSTGAGIFRNGAWHLTNAISSSPVPNYAFSFGVGTDVPITGDWDGNGSTSVGVFRGGAWYLTNAITGSPVPNLSFFFGVGTDVPVTGSWGATVSDDRIPVALVATCAQTLSCEPGPNDWYGARSLANSKAGTPQGWTGPAVPPPPGWTGLKETPPAGWTGMTPLVLPTVPLATGTPTPVPGPGGVPPVPGDKGGKY